MAEITTLHVAILAGSVAAGAVIGWLVRGSRCAQEKLAVNEGWQQQLEAQRTEHTRLLQQNKGLMEQVNQFQASAKDATNRARELSGALKEAFERRDELQRELKEIRSNLEVAVRQRERLQSDIRDTTARGDSVQAELKRKDDKIFRLSRELENWQNRLPPLLERYRERDREAARLEEELRVANERLATLESNVDADETSVEPSSPESLGDALDASNDPDGPAQDRTSDDAADDIDQEPSFSDFVGGIGTDIADDVGAGADAHVDDEDEDLDAEDTPAAADADEETSIAGHDHDGRPEDGIAGADDEDGTDPGPWTGEIDTDEQPVGEADRDDAVAAEPAATEDDSGAWRSATSAEFSQLEDQGPGAGHDDLKLIKGIGPAIEKTLNELGIFRYDQIADMSEYDIDRVARRLKGFRSRIYREDWIGQARDLQLQKTAN